MIGGYIIVPRARAELIREKFNVHDQPTEAGKYYALYNSDPNWKELSLWLYRAGETVAVDIARPHIQTVIGMNNVMFTCTTHTRHVHMT